MSSVTTQSYLVMGTSGTNPEWVPCRQVWLVVNDLIRKFIRDVKSVMALRKSRLGKKTFITCLVGRSCTTVSVRNTKRYL